MAAARFRELSRGTIGKNKDVVVSEREDGRYSLAQQVKAETDGNSITMYLKNAIIVDYDGLLTLQDTVNKSVAEAQILRQIQPGVDNT